LFFANTDWYLYNFRLSLAQALRERGDEVVMVSPDGSYRARLQALGFKWVDFPLRRRSINPFAEITTFLRLFSIYRNVNPDLVHHFTVKCVLYGSLVCHLLGIRPVVNSITGLGYVYTKGRGIRGWLRGLITLTYRLALRHTWVIFQNPDDRAIFLNNRLADPDHVAMIRGSGVDIHRFTPQPEPAGGPLVIFPGRLLWDKGVREFVEAARQLNSSVPNVRFALVGDIDNENPSSVKVPQLNKWVEEGVIEWWGWKENMEGVYAQASIVCLPSYQEGLPKTLIEAAASGRAIVASNVPGCREVVRTGENGLLVSARDVTNLVEALNDLLQDPGKRSQMGVNGRIIAEKEFSSEVVISQTLAVYDCCIKGCRKKTI